MLKVALDHSAYWLNRFFPEGHCSIYALTVAIIGLLIGEFGVDHRPRGGDLSRAELPLLDAECPPNVNFGRLPILTIEQMNLEAQRVGWVGPDAHAAVAGRVAGCGTQDPVAVLFTAERAQE